MKKSELIKTTLSKMLETQSLNEITVQKLCKECGINRQIFYYHYKDINDVLADYFLGEKIDGLDKAKNWPMLVHDILQYANKHRQLILKTLKSKSAIAVETFFYDNLYKKGRSFIEAKYKGTLDSRDINEVTGLISDALSREISRLLANPLELSMASIEETISKTFDGVLDLICENKKKRKKV